MTDGGAFICPRCSRICQHPLEVYFQWCPHCKTVTGIPRACPHLTEAKPQTPWQVIRDIQDDLMIAIQGERPLPTAKLQALPPWRALMIAEIAWRCGVDLEQGSIGQLKAEAVAVGGEGKLGDWWTRRV